MKAPALTASYNAAALDSIMAQDYGGPMEVIVADGSNSPATSKLVRRHYPYVRLVPNPNHPPPPPPPTCAANFLDCDAKGP